MKLNEYEQMEKHVKGKPNITPGDKALANILNNKEALLHTAEQLNRMFNGEAVNKDPLIETPKPEMRLYQINSTYFESREDLEDYCQRIGISCDAVSIFDYIRTIADRKDVIQVTDPSGKSTLYCAIDDDGYGVYNPERSTYRGKFTWEYNYGCIRDLYVPFREKGVTFENDVYGKIEERKQTFLKMCRSKKR